MTKPPFGVTSALHNLVELTSPRIFFHRFFCKTEKLRCDFGDLREKNRVVSRWNLTLQNRNLLLDTTAEEWILSGESDLTPRQKTITRAV